MCVAPAEQATAAEGWTAMFTKTITPAEAARLKKAAAEAAAAEAAAAKAAAASSQGEHGNDEEDSVFRRPGLLLSMTYYIFNYLSGRCKTRVSNIKGKNEVAFISLWRWCLFVFLAREGGLQNFRMHPRCRC